MRYYVGLEELARAYVQCKQDDDFDYQLDIKNIEIHRHDEGDSLFFEID